MIPHFSLALLLTLATPVPAADWPLFQKDPQHTGQAYPQRMIQKPVIRWKQPVGIAGWLNYPLIAEGMVYISSSGYLWQGADADFSKHDQDHPADGVYAFDLRTGTRRWYAPAYNDVNGIAWDQGLVLATGDEGAVWALDARTGQLKWRKNLGASTYQLLVHQGVAYTGDEQGRFYALDVASGKILWQLQLQGAIRAGAALAQDHLILGTTAGQVYSLSLKGKIRWQRAIQTFYPQYVQDKTPIAVYASATIYQKTAILGFARDSYYAEPALISLDLDKGQLVWTAQSAGKRENWGNIRTSPVLYGDLLIYAEPYSNEIVAISAQTGQVLGSIAQGVEMFPQWASPALSGDLVVIPRHDGGLYALDADRGRPMWAFYIGEPHLAGPQFPEGIASGGGATYTHPTIGDAIFSSPAISAEGEILVAAGGYLYCISDESWR